MDNVVLVDAPIHWPCMCVLCGSQKGPIADTAVERNGERMYVCKRCVMTLARTFGFVKGEKLEELSRAVDELAARDQQIQAHADRIDALSGQLAEARRRRARRHVERCCEQAKAKEQTARAYRGHAGGERGPLLPQLAGAVTG
jgi:hypothetical protein